MAGAIPTQVSGGSQKPQHFAFAVMTSLFFIWGFITALNDILIPHLKEVFSLNYTQAMLVQFCFFGAYFIVSPFAGMLIEKIGYRRGIITGLCTIALGCALFYPAAEIKVYAVFLLALFVLASGITLLQVSANPYVAILGPEKTSASRLNLAQAINSLGHTLGPLFGTVLIFGAAGAAITADAVKLPYLILAGAAVFTALIFKAMHLPDIQAQAPSGVEGEKTSVWQHRHLMLGVIAIFLYVGAEVAVGSFLVNYFAESHIGGLSAKEAGAMVSYYWGAAMIGRFIGAALTRIIAPVYVLAGNASLAICLIVLSINSVGEMAMWSILAVGFFNSIMFPTIFSLAIGGLGRLTSRGSGLLCMAIVGGAILPVLQGLVADSTNVQLSFVVPALAYVYIGWYALYGARRNELKTAETL